MEFIGMGTHLMRVMWRGKKARERAAFVFMGRAGEHDGVVVDVALRGRRREVGRKGENHGGYNI